MVSRFFLTSEEAVITGDSGGAQCRRFRLIQQRVSRTSFEKPLWARLSCATTPLTSLILPGHPPPLANVYRFTFRNWPCYLSHGATLLGPLCGESHPSHDIPPSPYPPSPPHTIPLFPSENSCHPTSFLSHMIHPPHGSHPVREGWVGGVCPVAYHTPRGVSHAYMSRGARGQDKRKEGKNMAADFVPNGIVKSAVRRLTNPLTDADSLDAIVQSIILNNPFGVYRI